MIFLPRKQAHCLECLDENGMELMGVFYPAGSPAINYKTGQGRANEHTKTTLHLTHDTVLTMAGLAIGLGNVWRFPYMMGQHGGSAFLVIYVVFIAAGRPALSAEWSLGRATRSGPIVAFKARTDQNGLVAGPVNHLRHIHGADLLQHRCGQRAVQRLVCSAPWFFTGQFEAYHAGLGFTACNTCLHWALR